MKTEFLLIGRGIAGAVLSLKLSERGIKHSIIDQPSLSTSSKVAAGLVNPIVLKRLKLVAGANEYLHSALPFYRNLQSENNINFLHELPISHIFQSIGELNNWNEKASNTAFAPFLGDIVKNASQSLIAPHGVGLMQSTSWVDTIKFLSLHKSTLSINNSFEEYEVKAEDLNRLKKEYKNVIVCNGQLLRKFIPDFEELFSPTRGEVMIIETEADLPKEQIIHGPVFILPLGNKRYKVGATYHWDHLKDETTTEGLDKLKSDLKKIFRGEYKVVEHKAGVRPNTKDRKPILGKIEDNLYCFNGLGSRGVLMAPLLADQLLENILSNTPLDPTIDLSRFT